MLQSDARGMKGRACAWPFCYCNARLVLVRCVTVWENASRAALRELHRDLGWVVQSLALRPRLLSKLVRWVISSRVT